MTDLKSHLAGVRTNFDRIRQRKLLNDGDISRTKEKLETLAREKADLLRVTGLIDRVIEIISANGIGRIEQTVSNGLQLVFNDQEPLSLKIEREDGQRGNYVFEVQQVKDGEIIQGKPLETFGGGVANVAAFLLRVMLVKRFDLARVLIVDESFNNVHSSYLPMVSELLKTLAHDGGFTIFAVSHQPRLTAAADHVYRAVPPPKGAGEGAQKTPILQKLTKLEIEKMRRAAEEMD